MSCKLSVSASQESRRSRALLCAWCLIAGYKEVLSLREIYQHGEESLHLDATFQLEKSFQIHQCLAVTSQWCWAEPRVLSLLSKWADWGWPKVTHSCWRDPRPVDLLAHRATPLSHGGVSDCVAWSRAPRSWPRDAGENALRAPGLLPHSHRAASLLPVLWVKSFWQKLS